MINWKKFRKNKTDWIIKNFDLENEVYPKWIAKFVRFFNNKFIPFVTMIVIFFLMFKIFERIYLYKGFEITIIIMILIIITMLRNQKEDKED